MTSKKTPPTFFSPYSEWKEKVLMWQMVTSVPVKEQGILVRLVSFENDKAAERTVSRLKKEVLNSDDGLEKLLACLDEAYKTDETDEQYAHFLAFMSFRRGNGQGICDYIQHFEHLYHKMVGDKEENKIGDNNLAYLLLDNAKLSSDERKLAFTAIASLGLSFKHMKAALKRVFSSPLDSSGSDSATFSKSDLDIKQEEAFYTKRGKRLNNLGLRNRGSLPKTSHKLNPVDKQGKISRCVVCGCKFHWADSCPYADEQYAKLVEDGEDDGCTEFVNLVLMTEMCEVEEPDIPSKEEILVAEAATTGTVDTACTKTVAGENWFASYKSKLSDKLKQEIVVSPSKVPFKFGDGRKVISKFKASIPIEIGGTRCSIETEVVDANIPLLISLGSLVKADAVLDLANKRANILGKDVILSQSSAGHYLLDILPNECSPFNEKHENVLFLENDLSDDLKAKQVSKLHRQFGHASAANLKKLIKNSDPDLCDTQLSNIIDAVISKCEVCLTHKKPDPRPVVAFNKSSEFNGTVSMDLHQLEDNLWYLHIVDEFSKFSAGAIINKKSASAYAFLKTWVSVFGAPNKVFSDNGGEFISDDFYEICELFNISVVTTPAKSPWSNGVCERHNQILTNIMLKIKDDVKSCNWHTALAWALSAKNSLLNSHGFSPAQLVFGRNTNLPSALNNKLPALEDINDYSPVVSLHLSVLNSARQAYIAAESSSKIKLALKKQTRPTGKFFKPGDKVYYKRDENAKWKGPAIVLGQDSCVVFVRHGSRYLKVHTCRLQHAIPLECTVRNEETDSRQDESPPAVLLKPKSPQHEFFSDSDCEDSPAVCEAPVNEAPAQQSTTSQGTMPIVSNSPMKLKKNDTVSFLKKNSDPDGRMYKARVLGSAGKRSGPLKHWYNIEYESPHDMVGKQISIDMKSVNLQAINDANLESNSSDMVSNSISINEPSEVFVVINQDDFVAAKAAELKSWQDNGVYIEVPHCHQKCLSVRWVCSTKKTDSGIIPKARLVVRGYEEDSSTVEKNSPTCSKDALRVLLSVSGQQKWDINTIDIKTAFLQGADLERTVFVKPPSEANVANSKVWQLKKCVYGLTDASLHWYKRVHSFLLSVGAKVSKCDPALFYWLDGKEVSGILTLHVDDILWCGSTNFVVQVIDQLRATFSIGKEAAVSFQYLGLKLNQGQGTTTLNQSEYCTMLKEIPLNEALRADVTASISSEMKDLMRAKIGQLLWVANQTRPDLSFGVSNLAVKLNDAKISDIIALNKVIRRARTGDVDLQFSHIDGITKLVCFTDAAFGNLPDGGSQGSYLLFLVGENGDCNLLSWQSKRLKRVARSSLAAESLAMSDCVDAAVYIATMYKELMFGCTSNSIPIEIVTDNKSLCDALQSKKVVTEKRLRIDIAALKESIENGSITSVTWVNTNEQLADCLTKEGASPHKLIDVLKSNKLQI